MLNRIDLALVILFCVGASMPAESLAQLNSRNWTGFAGSESTWTAPVASFDPGQAGTRLAATWDVEVGFGKSCVVTTDELALVFCGVPEKQDGITICNESLVALERKTGEQRWRLDEVSEMHPDQETFSGDPVAPQATPVIAAGKAVTIGFTGRVNCVDLSNGQSIWQLDLLEQAGATPVQFGFAASPVVVGSRVFILAPGTGDGAGLLCLNLDNGELFWRNEIDGPAYATPVLATLAGVQQFVVMTNSDARGIDLDGNSLWQFDLSDDELTNVPTPLIVSDHSLLVSGQSVGGTKRLDISFEDDEWVAEEVWFNRDFEFFYCNWLKLNDDCVLGCVDNLLVTFDMETGERTGRWRGFGEGNVVAVNGALIFVDGKGEISYLQPTPEGLNQIASFNPVGERVWTPPAIAGDEMFIRTGNRVLAYSWIVEVDTENGDAGSGASKILENELAEPRLLEFETTGNEPGPDPIMLITDEFETKGQEAALALYSRLRAQESGPLTVAVRIELASLAEQQGLADFAEMILGHAVADFPDDKTASDSLEQFKRRNDQ